MFSFSSWNLKLDAIIYQVLGSGKITSPKSYSTLRRKFSIFNIPFPCLKEKKKLHLHFRKAEEKILSLSDDHFISGINYCIGRKVTSLRQTIMSGTKV